MRDHSYRILSGPTATGKTELAIAIAERLDAEIVAMDSMTLYRGMDIGTAKPSAEERRRVPHHLIDVLEPWESASVAWWRERALACCQEIRARGKEVLFVGGTPLYLKTLLYGLFAGPPADQALRERLDRDADALGAMALHQRLQQVDPAAAQRIHEHDRRRIIRALEVWELTGKPISSWQVEWQYRSPSSVATDTFRAVWLDLPRDQLYERINRRVERMFAAGFVDEVRSLSSLPQPLGRAASQALGYKEVLEHLAGRAALAETIEQVKTRTRQFAKRQLTWFRSLPEVLVVGNELTSVLQAFRIV